MARPPPKRSRPIANDGDGDGKDSNDEEAAIYATLQNSHSQAGSGEVRALPTATSLLSLSRRRSDPQITLPRIEDRRRHRCL